MEKSWNLFANVLGQKEIPRLEYLFGGFNYRLPKVGAIVSDGKLHANVENPGLTIRFTEDGSDPDVNSKVYAGPIPFKGQVKLRAFSTSENGGGISEIK